MSSRLWQRIEPFIEDRPVFLSEDDVCFFAREYIIGGSYQESEANRLILNFKKPPEKREKREWWYKQDAARQFAREVAALLRGMTSESAVAFIPTSKASDDPQYDPRFDMMAETLKQLLPEVRVETPIIRPRTCRPLHGGEQTRQVRLVYDSLGWKGFRMQLPGLVFLVDDVVTSGSHFKACQRLIREHHAAMHVIGLFWARAKRRPEPMHDLSGLL